jgi:hypothetical protein
MAAAGRKYLEGRIADERATQVRLRRVGQHAAADQLSDVIDRLLDRYLLTQSGKRRTNTPSHV